MVVAAAKEYVDGLEKALRKMEASSDSKGVQKTTLGDAVPGAFLLHGVLSEEECRVLERLACEMHRKDLSSSHPRDPRRDSQHHLVCWVEQECLAGLSARIRSQLPSTAGPKAVCPLDSPGQEISNFLRVYCYEEGDFSAPHFDRSYRICEKGTGKLERFSAYSIVIYLNDKLSGGETTFFKHDPSLPKTRKGNTPLVSDRSQLSVALQVNPKRGDALVFPHGTYPGCFPDPLHEGSVVQHGPKCIIRTDVMFTFQEIKNKRSRKNASADKTMELGVAQREEKERVEKLIQKSLEQISSSLTPFADDCVSFSPGCGNVEMRTQVANTIFWQLFKQQRAQGVEKETKCEMEVEITSDYGLKRSWTREALAQEIVDNLPNTQGLAFVCVDPKKAAIHFNSNRFVLLQSERGMLMCNVCGRFVKAHNGGLEWHLKNAHSVESHADAYSAVEKTTEALTTYTRPIEEHGEEWQKKRRLDPHDMIHAMRDRAALEASIQQGRIKSLGPFLDACRSGDLAAVRQLVESGVRPSEELDSNGASGLLWAAGFGNLDVCKYLVNETGLNVLEHFQHARRGYSHRHALHWAARNGHLDVVKWIVQDLCFPVDKPSSDGTTALCLAAWQGHLETVQYLVEVAGADVRTCNSYGCSLAMWACQGTSVPVCEYLYARGASFDGLNANGQGCLHKAAQRGNMEMCQWLVRTVALGPEHFAPNADEKSTPADLARFAGHDQLSRFLAQQQKQL